jgi:hypothetical protein
MEIGAQVACFLQTGQVNSHREQRAGSGATRSFNSQPGDMAFHATEPEPGSRRRGDQQKELATTRPTYRLPFKGLQAVPASSTTHNSQACFAMTPSASQKILKV